AALRQIEAADSVLESMTFRNIRDNHIHSRTYSSFNLFPYTLCWKYHWVKVRVPLRIPRNLHIVVTRLSLYQTIIIVK
ncbi:hypothetical protein, partial [Neobacillus vireti]|uniref:hypothetical protein n=1 Tax=Neobacillus vireti TaxID=220686 RepID=UPI002FFE9489